MDCEKYEPLLLDELYEELDELTSAAVKRHVAGCARCASILSGFRGTREAVSLPLVAVPEGLEERILAATREAQKVVPIRSRMSRVLSVAGSWAMRPQTAMAAVFLLMIGSSAFLIRSTTTGASKSSVSVTVAGSPAPIAAAPAAENESLDDQAAAAAHGPTPPVLVRPPPVATASALAFEGVDTAPVPASVGGTLDKAKKDGDMVAAFESPTPRASRPYAPPPAAVRAAPTTASGAPSKELSRNDPWGMADGASATRSGSGSAQQQATGQDPASLGAAEFRARNFSEATRQYDIAAQKGDSNSALWAAESTREGRGCAVALGRYDQLSRTAAGSWVGNEAALRAARCEINMGQTESARARLDKLAQSTSHQQAANQALTELNQSAARKATRGGPSAGGAAAPKAAAPAPPRAPQEKATDKNAF